MTNRVHIASLLVSLLLTACTADDGGRGTSPQAVTPQAVMLGAYTSQSVTRADSALLAEPTIPAGKSIGVYAYYHDDATWATDATRTPDFMFNQKAVSTTSDGGYTYAPLKYWPNEEGDRLSFIGYYPYHDGTPAATTAYGLTPRLTNTGTGLPTFDFDVKQNVKEQVDLLVSDLVANRTRSDGRVRLPFRHATSKVEFRLVVDDELRERVSYFTIHSFQLTNVYTHGRLTPEYNADKSTTLTWSDHATPHTYQLKTTEAYLLLPQPLGDNVTVALTYDLSLKSDGTTYQYVGGTAVPTDDYIYHKASASAQLNTLTPAGGDTPLTEWLPGHHYVYTIRLRANRIEFTGQVVDWGEFIWETIN